MDRAVPKPIIENLKSWNRIARSLRFIFVFLGCAATVSGLIATTFTEQLGFFWTKMFTFAASASIGLLTAFDIGGKANAVRRAWRNLQTAVLRYQEDSAYELSSLLEEYKRGEEAVGDVNYIPQKTEGGRRRQPTPNRA